MGVHCEINLFKPADGVYTPGSAVTGMIKYAVDQETVFNRITISLKGLGRLTLKHRRRNRNGSRLVRRHNEDYIDTDAIIQDAPKPTPIGCYETQFSFLLPEKIPTSMMYYNTVSRYIVKCKIMYYIRIRFDRPGLFKFPMHFKKDLTVVSGITPNLPVVPTIFGETKKLTQLFSKKSSVVNIKANIQKCVLTPGENIEFDYEVFNDSNVVIRGIETKLVEIYTFTSRSGRKVESVEDLPNTDSKTGTIKCGDTSHMYVAIPTFPERVSLENSKIAARSYAVVITAELPMPHRDAVLKIPLQIGYESLSIVLPTYDNEQPPSYWESMREGGKGNDDDDDNGDADDLNEEKSADFADDDDSDEKAGKS